MRPGNSSAAGDYRYAVLQGPLSPDEKAFLWRLVRRGLYLRLIIALALEWTGYSKLLAPDELTYRTGGWLLALNWWGDLLILPGHLTGDRVNAYFYLVGTTIYFFGLTEIPIKIINCVLGALACRYQYFIARELFGAPVAKRSATLMQFFPSVVLWSTLNIRDTCVIFLILMAAWCSYRLIRGFSVRALVQLSVAVWLITQLRDYLFMAVSLPILIALLVGRRGHFVRNAIVGVAAGLVLMFMFERGESRELSLEALSEARRGLASGGSSFHESVDVSTPGAALAFLPTALVYYFFSPFPWQITSILKAMSLPEMLIVYWLTPATLRGLYHTIRDRTRECLVVLLTTAFLTLSYAIGEGNVGTLYRHRAQTVPFYLMFAAVGLEYVRRRQAAAVAAAVRVGPPRAAWGR